MGSGCHGPLTTTTVRPVISLSRKSDYVLSLFQVSETEIQQNRGHKCYRLWYIKWQHMLIYS